MKTQDQAVVDQVLNATIIDRRDLTHEISIVRIRPDAGDLPDFVPGQFIKLGLPRRAAGASATSGPGRERSGPRLVRRAYSIASSPRDRDCLEFLMVRVERGKLTPQLWELAPGGRVWMDDRAAGHFTLEPIPPGQDVVMVATGTGIAPFVSMLRTHVREQRWRRAAVINGVRYAADLAYRDELEQYAKAGLPVTYIPIVSREPEPVRPGVGWSGLRGRVQSVLAPEAFASLAGFSLAPRACHVMLCGNPEMIVSVQRLLESGGFRTHAPAQPGNIHFERYW